MADTPQSRVIEKLSRGAEKRFETHVSHVFLKGDRAIKLKKAVKFPYLDYSTIDKRKHFCEREVALNCRTAPELYLGVEPVEIEGVVEDWVVVMRRFDDAALFDELEITPIIARELADRIAAFHDAAEVTPQYGGAAAMARIVDANRRDQKNSGLDRIKIDALHAAGRTALDRVSALLDARRADGRVRFGHGDLHLRNICLFGGKPTLFDGIEFDDAIACVDVLYDLAFLLMDLEHRGRRDIANRVLNRYLARRDEFAGLAAMPLFLSCRAGIRAHTNKDHSYLDLAVRLLDAPPPRLIAVGGLSGSGKSTLAEAIAPRIGRAPGAVVLRSDVIRKRLLGKDPEARLGPEGYTAEVSHRVYEAMRKQAAVALTAGASVIADAVQARPDERAAIEAVAHGAGVDFAGLWLDAAPEVLASRVRGRENDASDATVEVVREQLSYDTGAIGWRRLDASPDLAVTVDRACEALARSG